MQWVRKVVGCTGLVMVGIGVGCGGPTASVAGLDQEQRSIETAVHRAVALVFWETVQDRLIDGAHVDGEDLSDVFWMRDSHREQVRNELGALVEHPEFVELVVLVDGYMTDWLAAARAGDDPTDRTGLATFFQWKDRTALYGDTYGGERGVDRNGLTPERLREEGYGDVLRVRRGEDGGVEADFPPPWSSGEME